MRIAALCSSSRMRALARSKSRVVGASKVRKLLRRLPDKMREEIVSALNEAGPKLLGRARGEAPRRSGALASALAFKVYPRTLRLRLGLLTKRLNRDYFYGHILEVGRKAQTKTVRRRTSNGVIQYALRISPISPGRYDMVGGRTKSFAKNLLRPLLARIYERALRKAASGG